MRDKGGMSIFPETSKGFCEQFFVALVFALIGGVAGFLAMITILYQGPDAPPPTAEARRIVYIATLILSAATGIIVFWFYRQSTPPELHPTFLNDDWDEYDAYAQ